MSQTWSQSTRSHLTGSEALSESLLVQKHTPYPVTPIQSNKPTGLVSACSFKPSRIRKDRERFECRLTASTQLDTW